MANRFVIVYSIPSIVIVRVSLPLKDSAPSIRDKVLGVSALRVPVEAEVFEAWLG